VINVADCDVDGRVTEGAGDWLMAVAVVVLLINQSRNTMMSDESEAGEDERRCVFSSSVFSILLLFDERHLFALKIGGGSGGMSSSGTGEITACTNGVISLLTPDEGNTTEGFFGSQQGSRRGLGEEMLDLKTTLFTRVVDGETDASGSLRSHS